MMRPRLEIGHFAMLDAMAEEGAVGRAAARLGLTQSALTHRIRQAERRLGTALFERVGRRLRMTPAGERLLIAGQVALDQLVRAEDEVRTLATNERRLVRLAQATYSRFHWLPDFLRFLDAHSPDLELDLVAQGVAREPLAGLEAGRIDVAMVHARDPGSARFEAFRLTRDPLVAIMAPDHPLAAKAFVRAEDFAEERYITYSTTAEPGFEWEAFFRPAGVVPRRTSRVELPEAIIDLVRAGFGVSILSGWAVEPEVADGTLISRPVTAAGLALDWWAVRRRAEGPDAPAGRLIEAMLAWGRGEKAGLAALGFHEAATRG